uniref:Protein kinase domain-containing protein n=1 Tax=Parascaris equorum TaxID=6256 RepID=A0A914S0F3_PAREQ
MAYMVMEYLEGGELFSRIIDEKNLGKGLGERLTKFYAWQMLNALKLLRYRKLAALSELEKRTDSSVVIAFYHCLSKFVFFYFVQYERLYLQFISSLTSSEGS